MPPKQNVTKKTTTQKQKQKKAKQQQQQQQGQNVKINIRVGETKKPRVPRKPSEKKQPPKQPPKPPPNVQIQQPQYVPMFLSQQPAQYFTPPVSTTALPITPPTTTISPITMTTTSPITPPTTTTAPIPTTTTIPNVIPTSQQVTTTPTSSIFNSFLDTTGQMLGNISDWSKRQSDFPTTFPSIVPRPPLKIQPPTPKGPTIKPIIVNPPSVELDTFTNFAPRQNIISNLVSYGDLDEPITNSFTDYGSSFANVDDWVQEAMNDFNESFDTRFTENETQTEQKMVKDFATQYQQPSFTDFGMQTENIPSAISATLREMETQTELRQPPPPPPRAQPPPPILEDFSAPTQDIKKSGIQQFVSSTPESLTKIGETRPVVADLQSELTKSAKKRETGRQQTIDEIIQKQKEKKKEEMKSEGMMGQMAREMEKRRNLLQPFEEDELEYDVEWDVDELNVKPKISVPKSDKDLIVEDVTIEESNVKPKISALEGDEELTIEDVIIERKPIEEKNRLRKPGSGRPKGSGNKSDLEKQYEMSVAEDKLKIKEYKLKLKELRNGDYPTEEEYDRAVDNIGRYEELIQSSLRRIEEANVMIERERELRRLPTLQEDFDMDFEK